ncbi:BZ3500_MvSof-1268-A1-R1_Chr7-1g09102 [Microbotryum saponariae]|uniref:BZ3500_MvSof-1268-A1-R1_Chr7-1g09102 protein n=1 Tax=Microbotryum saponariae TaxID=289078 RepID=A0A2X0KW97_9BASI|nr:BZ3501_MvSof-1269-A2-R1_Chr7-1g08807 [Microbotryum saponariae]SDA02807.1 BZ3500_MvSof-1268-A1-R1_Chr7-1g09102 [Microbotryum saponariae]
MVIVLPKQITSTKWLVANGQAHPRCGACVLISQSRGLPVDHNPPCIYLDPNPEPNGTAQEDPTSLADQLFDQHAAQRKAKRQKRIKELDKRLKLMEDKLKARRLSNKKDAIPASEYTPLTPPTAEERDALLRSLVPRKMPSPPPRHLPPTLEPLYTGRFEEVAPEVSWRAAHLGHENQNLVVSSPQSGSNRSGSSSGHSEASEANERTRNHSTTSWKTTASSIWPPGGPPHSPDSSRSNHSGGSPKLQGSNEASRSTLATAYQDRVIGSMSAYYPTHQMSIEASMPVQQYAPHYPAQPAQTVVDLRPNSSGKAETEYVAQAAYPSRYQGYDQSHFVLADGSQQTYHGDHSAHQVRDQRCSSSAPAYPVEDGGRQWVSPGHPVYHDQHQQHSDYPNTHEEYAQLEVTYSQPLGAGIQEGHDQGFSHIYQNGAGHDPTAVHGYGGQYMGQ